MLFFSQFIDEKMKSQEKLYIFKRFNAADVL